MPKSKNQVGKSKRTANARKPVRRPKVPKRLTMTPYQRLLVDPCSADLRRVRVSGEESGYVARFKTHESSGLFHGFTSTVENFAGYVAWFPGYHNQAGAMTSGRGMNLFGWWSPSAATSPLNDSDGVPFGGSSSASARSVADPVNSFLTGSTAQSARGLAACMSMRYLGRLDATAGEYCVLTGINSDVLVGGLASVNDLFALADNSHRLTTKTIDVRYNPTDVGCRYRTEGISASNNSSDRCVMSGSASSAARQGDSTSMQKAIVIAFRGVQQNASPTQDVLQFSLSKAVEWLPQAGSGLSQPSSDGGGEAPDQASAALDRRVPGWRTIQTGDSPVEHVIQAAYTGTTSKFRTRDFDLNLGEFGSLHIG